MKHPQPNIEQHATVLDTLTLARKIHPGQRNSLDALCKRYEIDASKRDVHGALIDSELLAHVYLAMTGGQTALLLDVETLHSAHRGYDGDSDVPIDGRGSLAGASDSRYHELPVIKASREEVAAHEKMLQKIRKSGACAWDID